MSGRQGPRGRPQGWQAIRDDVLARIRAREWPPGAPIPHEADLAEAYGAARATVNRALRALAEAGWLDRRRKAGTRVALNPVRRATFDIPVIRLEVEGRGMTHAHRLLAMCERPATAAEADRLALPAGATVLALETLHLADDRPWAWECRIVWPKAAPGVREADLTAISVNEWLVRNAPFSHGSIAFSAVAAGREAAGRLGCAPGAALFAIDRTTWAGPDPITEVRLLFAPGHVLSSTI